MKTTPTQSHPDRAKAAAEQMVSLYERNSGQQITERTHLEHLIWKALASRVSEPDTADLCASELAEAAQKAFEASQELRTDLYRMHLYEGNLTSRNTHKNSIVGARIAFRFDAVFASLTSALTRYRQRSSPATSTPTADVIAKARAALETIANDDHCSRWSYPANHCPTCIARAALDQLDAPGKAGT